MKSSLKFFGIITLAAIIGFGFITCGDGGGGGETGPNIKIDLSSDELPLGGTLDLSNAAAFYMDGTKDPNVNITWMMKDAKGSGATVSGSTLTAGETGIGTNWGEVILTATADGKDFSKNFSFWLNRWNPNTKTLYFSAHKGEGWANWSTGDNYLFPSNVTLAKNATYNVTISGTFTGFIIDHDFTALFIYQAPPNYNRIEISDYGWDSDDDSILEVYTNNNVKSANSPYNRIEFSTNKYDYVNDVSSVSDTDVGKIKGKITNAVVTVTKQ